MEFLNYPEMALKRSNEFVHLLHLGGFKFSNIASHVTDPADQVDGLSQSPEQK